jgi:hypothetical protein
MTDNSKKLSELPVVTNAASTDRVLILRDPAGSPSTRTIAVSNLVSSIAYANTTVAGTVKVGNNLSVNATGFLNSVGTGNIFFTNNAISSNSSGVIVRGQPGYTVNIISNTYSRIMYNPNVSVSDSFTNGTSWVYAGPDGVGVEVYNGGNVLSAVYASNTGVVTLFGNSTYIPNKLQIGTASGYDFGNLALIQIDSSANTYQQIVIQNANSGTQASGDLVITADNGNDSFGYVDLGINSSNYSNATYGISGAGDAYLYSANSQLIIGTATVKDVVFHAGGTAANNRVLTVNTSAVTVNSAANLTVTSNTLNLGTSTISANGYTYLPNGMKMNWGKLVCNTVSQITFSSAFSTALVSLTVTPASNIYVGANTPYVFASNTTTANVYSGSTTTTNNVYFVAIGY